MDSSNLNGTAIGPDDILAVVVLYERNLENAETLVTLDESCRSAQTRLLVFVYDNSPHAIIKPDATASKYRGLDLEYVHDESNPGLSRAYNASLRRSIELNRKWLLILDQDSCVEIDFLTKTMRSASRYPCIDLHLPVAMAGNRIVSPVKLRLGRDAGFDGLEEGLNAPSSFFAINSGMLVRADYLRSVGGYDERFSLYNTDNWFCHTYSLKRKTFAITGARIEHDLARDTCKDRDRCLWIYEQSAIGNRLLYSDSPLTLLTLSLFGFAGAVKRMFLYRDIRYLAIPFGVIGKKT
jgi:hypothetical protein